MKKTNSKNFLDEVGKAIVVLAVVIQMCLPAGAVLAVEVSDEPNPPIEEQLQEQAQSVPDQIQTTDQAQAEMAPEQTQETPVAQDSSSVAAVEPETPAEAQQAEDGQALQGADTAQVETPQVQTEVPVEIPAGDPAAVNANTGDGSDNTAQTNVNNDTDITNNNNAVTNNNAFLKADTGHNNASYNTGSGIISTQRAMGQGEMVNLINKNNITVDPNSTGPAQAVNANTGDGSDNIAQTNINNQLTVRNINSSNTANIVDANVYSGENSASHNTSHGIILTGDADLALNFISFANTNLVNNQKLYANWQNVFGDFSGNIDLSAEAGLPCELSDTLVRAFNSNTGAGSNNQAIVNVNGQTQIINQNSGTLANQINANVISGKNKSSYNSGTGSVTSGDVNSSVNILNFLNTNITSSNVWLKNLNVFGQWSGNILLPQMGQPNLNLGSAAEAIAGNSGTGESSNNEANVNVNNSLSLDNQNQAVINNNVSLKTNTGDNLAGGNTGSGVIKFGSADAQTNELNVANLNITGDSWWMVVVNKFGGWSGTALGAPEDAIVDGSPSTTIITPKNSGIVVGNSPTGPDSNNIAGANINHSTDIQNLNDAKITNDITVNNITGENETQFNTGHGYIESGDIRSSVNLINFANANITAGNWMVLVVNVFGQWDGNLVFKTAGVPAGTVLDGAGDQPDTGVSANTNTGDGSSNNANSTTNNDTDITNNNNANTNNDTSASSISGENNASYNTGSGIISTGGAETGSSTGNQVNNNNVGVGQQGSNDSSAQNNGTGEVSDNNAGTTANNSTDITNNNNADTNNSQTADNVTGQNQNSYNTGDGLIDTGWARTYLGVYNQENNTDATIGDLQSNIDEVDPGTSDDNNGGGGGAVDNGAGDDPVGDSPAINNNGGGGGGGGGGGAMGFDMALASAEKKKKRGDLNGDGKVDDYDFSILMAGWGMPQKDKRADANEDGKVDDFDFSIVMSGWDTLLASKPIEQKV